MDEARLHHAAEALRSGMEVHRVPRTMVIQISYTSRHAEKAARLANAFAEAYLADQLNAKIEATKRASHWLEERMAELKQKAVTSDFAVQKYKEDHNLIASGGKLINEQQLNELNTQLILARAETARAEARFKRIDSIVRSHETEAIVSEAIGNTIIAQLRTKYLDASKRESEISAKLGKDHSLAMGLRQEMAEYERLMFEELGRLAEGYRSEVKIAKSKEDSLAASLEKLVSVNANENKVLVGLRELEREGEAYRNLYQSYLQRHQEALQQQSFPIIEARIITSASPPTKPSHPKKGAIFMLFLVLGLMLGTILGLLRESRERGFQSDEQVKKDLGLECLGILPLLPSKLAGSQQDLTGGRSRILMRQTSFVAPQSSLRALQPDPRYIPPCSGLMSYVLDNPGSGFAETLLAVKLAADVRLAGQPSKVIGTVSCLPSEGKSSFSKNFGSLLAKLDAKTLLIDADLRAPKLTRSTAHMAKAGLIEAVMNGQPLDELLWVEENSGLAILPTITHARLSHTSEFLASPGMREVLAQASAQFDYVLIDLPPLGPVVDARAIAPQIDAFVVIVEWRRTARKMVRNIFSNEGQIYQKCMGVVLNKVNISDIKLYENYGSRYFHYKDYAKSYYLEPENPEKGNGLAGRSGKSSDGLSNVSISKVDS
jgi:succinoglycan biosynthesis transport protein ExoP